MAAWLKLRALLRLAETKLSNWEIHGFGRLRFDGDGVMVCDDVDIPEQTASSAHITSSASEFACWQIQKFALREGMKKEEVAKANEEMKRWRLWWHSHGDMHPSYSNTDDETLSELSVAVGGVFVGMVCKSNLRENTVYVSLPQPVPAEFEGMFPPSTYIKLKDPAEPLDVVPKLEGVEDLFKRVTKKEVTTGAGNDRWHESVDAESMYMYGMKPDEFSVYANTPAAGNCVGCGADVVKAAAKYKIGNNYAVVATVACSKCLEDEDVCTCSDIALGHLYDEADDRSLVL